MFVTIITDCNDGNARNRLSTRSAWLFDRPATMVGVSDFNTPGNEEVEAALNLVDTLDASQGTNGVVLVNVANRHGKGKKWPNGTPFGYFKYKDTWVVSTVDGQVLSLAKKLGISDHIMVTDIPTVLSKMVEIGVFPEEHKDRIINTQFRSYEYQPRLAKWLHDGIEIPAERLDFSEISDLEPMIMLTDNFGNCVTSVLPEEIGHEVGKVISTPYGEITCYSRMKDVPNGEAALIVGSNGIDHQRLVVLTIQGKSAANTLGIFSGMPLLKS